MIFIYFPFTLDPGKILKVVKIDRIAIEIEEDYN